MICEVESSRWGEWFLAIQDGLNLELNSWSPRSILCFLVNCRVIEPLEIRCSVIFSIFLSNLTFSIHSIRLVVG
jgi:hypothetical protein